MPQDKQKVEQSLADLAIAEVGSKLPKLVEKLLGFQVVETNDEGTRAAGILGYDVGGSMVLSPVLFLNGRIKAATDVLYLADSDVFTSATPAWVEYLLSRASGVTGQADRMSPGAGVSPTQALSLFNRPPQINGAGKVAAAPSSNLPWGSRSDWGRALPCAFRELFTWWTRPEKIAGTTKTAAGGVTGGDHFTIPNALRSLGPTGYAAFIKQATEEFPEVLEKFAQFHDLSDLVVTFSPEEIAADRAARTKTAAPAVPPLSFVEPAALDLYPELADTLNDAQKTAVLQEGLCVIDKRAADQKAQTFDDDHLGRFQTPTESGFYEIFNDLGKLHEVYVEKNPFLLHRPDKKLPAPMIVEAKGGQGGGDYFIPKDGDAILVRAWTGDSAEAFEKRFEKMTPIEDAGRTGGDERYVAVSPTGVASAPFEIRGVTRDADDTTTLAIHTDDDMERRLLVPPRGDEATGPDDVTNVRLVDAYPGNGSLRVRGGVVFVPRTYRVLRVQKAKADDVKTPVRPGDLGLLVERTGQGMGLRKLEVKKEAGTRRFVLRQSLVGQRGAEAVSRPLDKTAALKLLIGNLGFDEAPARAAVQGAVDAGSSACWFVPPVVPHVAVAKTAQLLPGTPFPVDDEPTDTDERGRPQAGARYGFSEVPQERMPVPGPDEAPDAEGADPVAAALGGAGGGGGGGGGFGRTGRRDVDLVMRAAEGGQDVFDPAMMGMILKTNRTQAQVDEWLESLSDALDKLCRNLLLLYWRNSDMAQSYGQDELPELESSLLSGIKVMGEIVLFYKQKASEDTGKKIDAFAG